MVKKPTYEELEQRVRELEKGPDKRAQLDDRPGILSLAIDQSSEGIAVVDIDGNLEYLNTSFAAMHGYSPEELIGKNLNVFHSPSQLPSVDTANEQIKKMGYFKGEIWHVKRDGTEFPSVMHNTLIKDAEGKPIGIIGTIRDITERKRQEEHRNSLEKDLEKRTQELKDREIELKQSVLELEAIVDALPGLVAVVDRQFHTIVANKAVVKKFGNSDKTEVLGRKCHKVRKGLDDVCPQCAVARAFETGEPVSRVSTPEEESLMGMSSKAYAIPLRDENGAIWGGVEVIMDVTDLREKEKALRKSEAQLSNAMEIAKLCYWEYDVDTNLFTFNDHFYSIFRTSAEQVGGYTMTPDRYAEVFVHPEDKSVIADEMLKALETTDPNYSRQLEHRMVYADGETGYIAVRFFIVKDERGRTIKTYGANQDITDRKRVEEEKKELEDQLQRAEKMEAIGTLAGGVAHDLNNVLSGLVSYPDLLLLDLPADSSLREAVLTIQDSGKKATAIVQDLLTLARRGVSISEVTNLNDVVNDYLKSPEYKKLKSFFLKAQIKTDLQGDLLNVMGSPVHLSKMVMNLVSNAVESLYDEGIVTLKTRNQYIDTQIKGYDEVREGDYVVLTVADNGSGIETEDLAKIFEPFYTKKIMGRSGTGLGMAVVWGTVKDHNGYIDVRSTRGKGSEFTLYFPITREEAEKGKILSISEYAGNGEKILVVDDVSQQREIASSLLNKLGYSVATVSSGEEAVEYMKEESVDLVILDMIMDPGIDGLDTYKKILEIRPKQKALIASGFSETDRVKETQRLGAGQYVKKPYTLEKIGQAVKEELKRQASASVS